MQWKRETEARLFSWILRCSCNKPTSYIYNLQVTWWASCVLFHLRSGPYRTFCWYFVSAGGWISKQEIAYLPLQHGCHRKSRRQQTAQVQLVIFASPLGLGVQSSPPYLFLRLQGFLILIIQWIYRIIQWIVWPIYKWVGLTAYTFQMVTQIIISSFH